MLRPRRIVLVAVATVGSANLSCRSDEAPSASATDATAAPTSTRMTPEPPMTQPSSTDPATTGAPTTMASTTEPPTTVATTDALRTALETSLSTDGGPVPVAERMAELKVPGIALAVVVDGQVVAELSFGTTPTGEPMTPDTLTQVGSVSKPVAAIGAVAMASPGALPWDTDLAPLLTSYALPPGAQTADAPVTLQRLLSHTAGTSVDGFLGYATAADAPSLPDVLAGRGNTPAVVVERTPGTGFSYSGGGYELVEQTMIDVAGAPSFDELMRTLVFEPAGMTDSRYAVDLGAAEAARATGGSIDGVAMTNRWQSHPEGAAAGLWTTAADLGRLLAAFGRSLAGTDDTLVPTKWARQMVTPAVGAGGEAVGHGWFLDDVTTPRYFRHNGRNLGFCADMAGSVDGRYGVAIVTNAFPGGTPLAREVIDTVATTQAWPDWTPGT